jgi:hypothetical protein
MASNETPRRFSVWKLFGSANDSEVERVSAAPALRGGEDWNSFAGFSSQSG